MNIARLIPEDDFTLDAIINDVMEDMSIERILNTMRSNTRFISYRGIPPRAGTAGRIRDLNEENLLAFLKEFIKDCLIHLRKKGQVEETSFRSNGFELSVSEQGLIRIEYVAWYMNIFLEDYQ